MQKAIGARSARKLLREVGGGRLETATLARDQAIRGTVYKAATLIWFDPDGNVTETFRYDGPL